MNKPFFLLSLAFLLLACAPPTAVGPTPSPVKLTTVSPTPLPSGTRIVIRSSSLSLIVEDPSQALSEIEQAVQDAGGFVVSASYYSSPDYGGYSNLSARLPPESLPELRQVALALASQIQSDSLYSEDVTSEYRLLRERLTELHRSEEHLWQLATTTPDRDLADSLTLLRELVRNETVSVESQLLSFEDRSVLASFDVTLNQTLQTQIFIE